MVPIEAMMTSLCKEEKSSFEATIMYLPSTQTLCWRAGNVLRGRYTADKERQTSVQSLDLGILRQRRSIEWQTKHATQKAIHDFFYFFQEHEIDQSTEKYIDGKY